jgi:hypothetical protein
MECESPSRPLRARAEVGVAEVEPLEGAPMSISPAQLKSTATWLMRGYLCQAAKCAATGCVPCARQAEAYRAELLERGDNPDDAGPVLAAALRSST